MEADLHPPPPSPAHRGEAGRAAVIRLRQRQRAELTGSADSDCKGDVCGLTTVPSVFWTVESKLLEQTK